MRYNPETERSLDIDAIAEQCRQAIMAEQEPTQAQPAKLSLQKDQWEPIKRTVSWSELSESHVACGKVTGQLDRSWLNCCSLSHGIEVAIAMGNWPEARRLRAQLIAAHW